MTRPNANDIDPVDIGITHDIDRLPDEFPDLEPETQRAIAGGMSREKLIGVIRKHIRSKTNSETDRLLKSDLVDLLVILEEDQ